jgi:POT family proton-dependent oligopeptide transporter
MSQSAKPYHTTPVATDKMPGGVPYIVGNEAAERFSFYGMRAILFVFMTKYLLDIDGEEAVMDSTTATIWQHNFIKAAYLFPIAGAVLCDWLFGKYRTILVLSVVYCLGHAVMALVDFPQLTGVSPQTTLWIALALIAVGTGGIKPCVSAHAGDQFGPKNKHLLPKLFQWFYFSINFGSAISTLLTPYLLHRFGPGVAFGVPGVLMGLATFVFWLGRHEFVHIPPAGTSFLRDIVSPSGIRAIVNLIPLYVLIAMFWCLFDQTTSKWIEQAEHMDRNLLGFNIDPSQNQATNPILVMLLIPLFTFVIYPLMERLFTLTPLRKIGIGMFLTVPAFALPAWVQMRIDAGQMPHISWQILAYLLLTAAEIMVSITALEFSYTQAPKSIKSFVMGLFLLSVFLGNQVTVWVNEYIQAQQALGVSVLSGANYYWFFTWFMLGTSVVYVVWSCFYRGLTFIQGDVDPELAH